MQYHLIPTFLFVCFLILQERRFCQQYHIILYLNSIFDIEPKLANIKVKVLKGTANQDLGNHFFYFSVEFACLNHIILIFLSNAIFV
jgi:hypothetical protein